MPFPVDFVIFRGDLGHLLQNCLKLLHFCMDFVNLCLVLTGYLYLCQTHILYWFPLNLMVCPVIFVYFRTALAHFLQNCLILLHFSVDFVNLCQTYLLHRRPLLPTSSCSPVSCLSLCLCLCRVGEQALDQQRYARQPLQLGSTRRQTKAC